MKESNICHRINCFTGHNSTILLLVKVHSNIFTYLIKGNNVGNYLFYNDNLINPFYYVFNGFLQWYPENSEIGLLKLGLKLVQWPLDIEIEQYKWTLFN